MQAIGSVTKYSTRDLGTMAPSVASKRAKAPYTAGPYAVRLNAASARDYKSPRALYRVPENEMHKPNLLVQNGLAFIHKTAPLECTESMTTMISQFDGIASSHRRSGLFTEPDGARITEHMARCERGALGAEVRAVGVPTYDGFDEVPGVDSSELNATVTANGFTTVEAPVCAYDGHAIRVSPGTDVIMVPPLLNPAHPTEPCGPKKTIDDSVHTPFLVPLYSQGGHVIMDMVRSELEAVSRLDQDTIARTAVPATLAAFLDIYAGGPDPAIAQAMRSLVAEFLTLVARLSKENRSNFQYPVKTNDECFDFGVEIRKDGNDIRIEFEHGKRTDWLPLDAATLDVSVPETILNTVHGRRMLQLRKFSLALQLLEAVFQLIKNDNEAYHYFCNSEMAAAILRDDKPVDTYLSGMFRSAVSVTGLIRDLYVGVVASTQDQSGTTVWMP